MGETYRFEGVIEAARGGGAVVVVPEEIATALGGLKQMRIVGTVKGVAYQSSTWPWQGRGLFMGVHKATREAAGAAIGETVEIEIARDDRPRTLELAPELEAALAAEPDLRARFDGLSFSRRRELADPIGQAVKLETRTARLDKALARLREPS